jgi:hypothetical protein
MSHSEHSIYKEEKKVVKFVESLNTFYCHFNLSKLLLKSVSIGSERLANNACSINFPKSASIIKGIQIACVASAIPKMQQQKRLWKIIFECYLATM